MSVELFSAIVGGICSLVGVYIRLRLKINTLESQLVALKEKSEDHKDLVDKIFDKLEDIFSSLSELRVDVANKQNRP